MKQSTLFNSLTKERILRRQQAHDVCRHFNRSPSKGHLKKLKSIFALCGDNVFIEPGFHCDYGNKIELGDRSYLNINCTLLDGGKIIIGKDCLIGPNVQILTINHPLSPKERLNKLSYADNVIINDNVWIGAGAIILPGITIEKGAVIGAGSVVTSQVKSNALYAGNPARKIKML